MTKPRVPPGSQDAHTKLVNECLLWLSDHGILALKNNTGAVETAHGSWMAFGLKGSADILAWIPPMGRGLMVECKTGNAVLSPQQLLFQRAALRAGCLHVTARSLDDLTRIPELRTGR